MPLYYQQNKKAPLFASQWGAITDLSDLRNGTATVDTQGMEQLL